MATQRRNALGRGLDALFSMDEVKTEGSSSINEIELSKITVNPNQPRHEFDPVALQELADSISEIGIIQPITLRKLSDDEYQIIAGERRFRASQLAGLTSIPAYIRTADDENVMEMALIENIQREDLNSVEIALAYQHLLEQYGLTQERLSERVGKKRTTIANYLRLLKLPDEIQLALKEGLISAGHAKAIAGAPADRQLHLLKRCIKKDLSVRQIEELVRSFNAQRPAEPAEDEEYPESYLRLVEQLERFFSQEISIKRSKNGGGKIVIDFAGDADIEKFLTRFADK